VALGILAKERALTITGQLCGEIGAEMDYSPEEAVRKESDAPC
jgi:hypothetical protein